MCLVSTTNNHILLLIRPLAVAFMRGFHARDLCVNPSSPLFRMLQMNTSSLLEVTSLRGDTNVFDA